MARKPVTDIAAWPALTLEGNLLSPAMIAAIDRREATEQDEAAYGVRKGLSIRDEISLAFRVGQAHFAGFAKAESPSAGATANFIQGFLRETLGFSDLAGGSVPVALTAGDGRVPVVVVPPTDSLDRKSASLSQDRSRSAALVLQDHLNTEGDALWGIATNGTVIRLMRDNASLTRPAFIEVNLAQVFETEDIASFAIFWLLFHRTRFGNTGATATDCTLERWRDAGAKAGEVARDRLAAQVEQALKDLGSGFLEANPALREKLLSHEIPLTDWFNELLHLVYRLIFLMVAEDRELLHTPQAEVDARRLYADGYSLVMLRGLSARRAAWDRHFDRYEGLKIILGALGHGEPRLGLPALGGLFAPGQLATLEAARLSNRAFLSAIFRLGWLSDKTGMAPVNWRAMETEELGSVYESLLELAPQLAEDGRALIFASETAEQRGNQRKTTGSYYTPDSLVQLLLDTSLDPVLDRTEAEASDPAESLLSLAVIDPACGSGHFLLAAARRIATRVARHRSGGTPSATDYRHALRDVARRCIHGVDLNPMAVELTKVALWIETVDPGLPLGFFDAQILCGDSLIGVFDYEIMRQGLPDEAFDPLTGDDKAVAKAYAAINKEQRDGKTASGLLTHLRMPAEITSGAEKLLAMPENTLDEVEAKRQAFQHLISGQTWWRLKSACDMYVAAFFMPKRSDMPDPRKAASLAIPTTEAIWRTIQSGDIRGDVQAAAIDIAMTNRAFHWPLKFPAIMAKGGFDAVLGNPPWERIKLQEQEFFAARDPEIATARNKTERDKLIKALKEAEPGSPKARLSEEFELAKRAAEAASVFARKTGRFPFTGTGDVNTYALFAEHFAQLARKKRDAAQPGRSGVIVPTGIATDSSTSAFFGSLVAEKRLSALFDFENRQGLFPNVHRSYKFSILAIGPSDKAHFAAFLLGTADLEEKERQIELAPDDFRLFNPNTLTAPLFRARYDKELTRRLYLTASVLVREKPERSDGNDNPWGIAIQSRLWHMTEDSDWFRTGEQLKTSGFHRNGPDWQHDDGRRYVPLLEAKMIHHFDHRFGSYAGLAERPSDGSLPETLESLKASPDYEADPWYWVPEEETRLRIARIPTRLKQYFRKEDTKGCLKVLAEWVLGTLPPDDLAKPALAVPLAEKRLKDILGPHALGPDIIGARIATWFGKVADNARKMQRETPLLEDDLSFIRQGPAAPLELTAALIDRKQPRWLMGWRDITNATNERTVVGGIYPITGIGNNLPVWHPNYELGGQAIAGLVAELSSLLLDYAARQKVAGTHLNFFYASQLPVHNPSHFTTEELAYLRPRVLELTYTSHSMRPWAEDLGYTGSPFSFNPERRAAVRAEIDAFFARKYNLSRDELRYILDPADVKGELYPSETFRGLKRNEEAAFGEYRTRRLVLEAWDRMEADGTFAELELGVGQSAETAARISERTALVDLPDGAWARATQQPHDAGAALTAILKAINGPTPSRAIRLAAAMMLEPHLLTPLLPDGQAREWRRLVGREGEPRTGNVVGFAARTNQGWGAAVSNHRGNGRLIEDLAAGTWAPGLGLDTFETASWPDGRAGFVLEALGSLDLDATVTSLPDEVRDWIRHVAAA